uniref:Uncharacterized protein n=1 Tax=Meloidogyne enterolobii TaxID=390850 RepID=A0A6V7Y4I9_MELEN|nr:unnamed protein product [Meloidogyne enterolobii]
MDELGSDIFCLGVGGSFGGSTGGYTGELGGLLGDLVFPYCLHLLNNNPCLWI